MRVDGEVLAGRAALAEEVASVLEGPGAAGDARVDGAVEVLLAKVVVLDVAEVRRRRRLLAVLVRRGGGYSLVTAVSS
eukprot:13990187-Alexandrium_andersonii.AAC.1